jgi:NitT/TauT family transport system substrate-binding protein
MERKKVAAIAVVFIVIASGVAVMVWFAPASPDVRIGYLAQDLHQLALRIAYVKGWFAEAGLRVELLQYQNGAYEMDGFLAGQIDMGYLGVAPALTKSINQNISVTVLATANLEGSAIMVHKGEYDAGRILNVTGLVNKTVFHPGPSSVQNFLLRLALNQSGLSYSDIEPVAAAPQNMAISLTPDAPAFIAWEPFPALAEYDNLAVPIALSHDIWPGHPCCLLASSDEFVSRKPDVVQKVVDIHKRAEEWIVANPAEAIGIAAQWLGVNATPVETAFNRIVYDFSLNRTAIEVFLTFLIGQEQVTMYPSEIGPYLDDFINATFIESSP